MRCPLCQRALVKMYRVIYCVARHQAYPSTGKLNYLPKYVPIWVCAKHEFSVEINTLRGGASVAQLLKEGKHLVRIKPGRKPTRKPPGSASDY
jgi:hypothetical protein